MMRPRGLLGAAAAIALSLSSCCALSTSSAKMPPQVRNNYSIGAQELRRAVLDASAADVGSDSSLDLNGIAWLEHINLVVSSRPISSEFYMDFLGFAKDKSPSFHVNLGQQQLHLAENGDPAQVVTGSIGLTVPNLSTIRERIANIRHTGSLFEGTQYAVLASEDSPMDDGVTAVSVASVPTQLPKHIAEGSRLVDMLSSARARVGRLDVIVMDLRDKEREVTKNARAARKDSKRSKFLKEREHIKTELAAAERELQAAQAEDKETLRVLEECTCTNVYIFIFRSHRTQSYM